VKDAEWIAELLRHGLLRGSFIPAKPQRQLRELTRHRTTLVQDRARVINRVQAVLEDANIKLASVVTDIRQMDYLDDAIDRVSAVIAQYLAAEHEAIALLDTIPGVSQRTAEILLAEIGTDMTRFPNAKSGFLGGHVPRPVRKWGQASQRQDPQRQSMVTPGVGGSRPWGGQNQADLLGGPVSAHCGPARQETRAHSSRTHHFGARVYALDPQAAVSGSGRGLF
jgi:hypothetical protein